VRRAAWAMLGLAVLLLLMRARPAAPPPATPPPPPATTPDDPDAHDPRRLEELAEAALLRGDVEAARATFTRAIAAWEALRYVDLREGLRQALVEERVGATAEAAERYRAAMADDTLRVLQTLRILSVHPDRDLLVAEALTRVRDAVAATAAGGQAHLYVTSRGEPRPLVRMTQEELLALAERGETARYCWIEALDLPADAVLPETLQLDRCVIGSLRASGASFHRLILTKSIVLGDTDLGQRFEGEANRSRTLPASTFDDLFLRDTVFVGRANFKAITVRGGRAWFPFAVFESSADLRAADLRGRTDLRFASFGADVSFRRARLGDTAWLGGARFRRALNFSGVTAERNIYLNSTRFESSATFEECEWRRDATFEDATFEDAVVLSHVRVDGWLNLSRARFFGATSVSRLQATDLDALGARFAGPTRLDDATISRRARFSPGHLAHQADAATLMREYRLYQGDEDADEPLVTGHSYGVRGADDLIARFESSVSFTNTVFGAFTVFEGVTFGLPGQEGVASFYNAQLLGESHLEHTTWHLVADFSTIFGYELALNDARFERALILDDANVPGRVNLAGATFADEATLSFDVAEINAFEIDPEQVAGIHTPHRLFYSLCADGQIDRSDLRIQRLAATGVTETDALRAACHASVTNELTLLRGTWSDGSMTAEADEAWWWLRHYDNDRLIESGSPLERLYGVVVGWLLFEVALGWGVELENLSLTVVVLVLLWAGLYRTLCRDVQITFFGQETTIGQLPFTSLVFVSLACFLLADYGLELDSDDRRVRALIAAENVAGVLMVTFFVGAYTRLILA
jgi:uncharacterized protein YjbI with pentapeptide repeats